MGFSFSGLPTHQGRPGRHPWRLAKRNVTTTCAIRLFDSIHNFGGYLNSHQQPPAAKANEIQQVQPYKTVRTFFFEGWID
jgi:hypothetical protein